MSVPDLRSLAKADWSAKTRVSPKATEGKPFQLVVKGTYGVRVVDPETFLDLMTSAGALTPHEIQLTLEKVIKRRLNSMIRQSVHTTEEVETHFGDVAVETRLGLKHQFSRMGLDLVDFLVTSIHSSGASARRAPAATGAQPRKATGTIARPRVGRARELKTPRRRA